MCPSVVEIGPARSGDLERVAHRMREADRIEVYEMNRMAPLEALRGAVDASEAVAVIRLDEAPVGVCGVVRLNFITAIGVPWMLGTDMMTRRAKTLLPHAAPVIRRMGRGYQVLRNVVHDDNKASIRWLRFMGFEIGEPEAMGWRGAPFRVFERETGNV